MKEIKNNANGLEYLFTLEAGKCSGIINGIDYEVWNPETDGYLFHNYNLKEVDAGKAENKAVLCNDFGFDADLPLFVFCLLYTSRCV